MSRFRSAVVWGWWVSGVAGVVVLWARERHVCRRLGVENATMRGELTSRDQELVHTVTVMVPTALKALHERDRDTSQPFRPEIADTDRGRKLKMISDLIVASDERYLSRVDQAVKGTLRAVMRRVQSLAAEQQVAISDMEDLHDDPSVLEGLLSIDHMNSQLGRRAQAIAVLCGAWPGQQRSASSLTAVVRGATSRIRDFTRVTVPAGTDVAVVPRAVEPVVLAVAELLDNAARHSQPGSSVEVSFRQEPGGMAVVIEDAGVGMSPEALCKATRLLSGREKIDIHRLGEPPQVGFAVIGVLAARYGFTVSVDTHNPRRSVRAVVSLPAALLTVLDPAAPAAPAALQPAASQAGVSQVGAGGDGTVVAGDSGGLGHTPGGLPVRRRRERVQSVAAAGEPAGEPVVEPVGGPGQAAALGAWQRGTRRHQGEGESQR